MVTLSSKSRSKKLAKSFIPPGRALSEKARRDLATKAIARLQLDNPEPKCELFFRTQFQLLVSVVLSAQATDVSVNKAMEPVYRAGFTPHSVIEWGEDKLRQAIKTIGLAPTKAKNVYRLSQILIEKHRGRVPRTREELQELPGVGRKTANVVLGELFKLPTLAVDTHVYRVTQRLGLQREANADKAEPVLMKVVDSDFLPAAHHWFILLGRYTCKATKPLCEQCHLTDICPTFKGKS